MAPVRFDLEVEGEGVESIATTQPCDFEEVGESAARYNCPMETSARNLELTEADLQGRAPEDLACNQCGGAFCGSRAGRILDGKPLIMCGQKEEVKEILASIGRR